MKSFKAAAPPTTPDMFCHSYFFLRYIYLPFTLSHRFGLQVSMVTLLFMQEKAETFSLTHFGVSVFCLCSELKNRGDDDFNPANAFHHDEAVDLSSSILFLSKNACFLYIFLYCSLLL